VSQPLTIWTIGHSARPLQAFLDLLRSQDIRCVADVRRHPGSRAHPHFNQAELAQALAAEGIEYAPYPELGGRRSSRTPSRHTVWRNASFRAYADYMDTPEFRAGLERLKAAGARSRVAMMCSEAVWWRCHRSLVADALKAEGVEVRHILDRGKVPEHPYTPAARIVEGRLEYGAAPES
jgi:uncharacterized protein (DUF488 family)